MLTGLHVKNFALIDEADIELAGQLNVLTGETGAGKSILLGAINLALGGRTSKDVIRSGTDFCLAELTFTCLGPKALKKAEELGISLEAQDDLVISRKLMANGKSLVRVNGETFSAAQVRDLTGELIDIYGQNEHQSLADRHKQLEVVDRYLKDEILELKQEVRDSYEVYTSLKKEYSSLDNDPASRERRIDMLSFEMEEIDEADIKEGEEEALKEEHRLLANSHIITEQMTAADQLLRGDDGGSDRISTALKCLSRVAEFDERISGFYDTLADIDSCLSDLGEELRDYIEDLPDGAQRLSEVEERLDLISHIKSKYGRDISQIRAYYESCAEELDKLTKFDSYCSDLSRRLNKAEEALLDLCRKLSDLRKKGADLLEQKITAALLELNFNRVLFRIDFEEKDSYTAEGTDNVQFMISLNPGEEARPLAKVASGGELSRIMLAIKSVIAVRDDIGTLIFDEIDTGISGRAAQKVADKLAAIAGIHQVICITHLPQIASMADYHLKIEKTADDLTTHVSITELDGQGIRAELIRLISGDDAGESIAKSADEMKTAADQRKKQIRQ